VGKVIIALGGVGGIDQEDCTAGRAQVLSGYTAGVRGEDDPAPGSMPERGSWAANVGMNESIAIPDGHHNGAGKVTGPAVTQRGAWNGSVGLNAQIAVPEGYHNGRGKVSGPNIAFQNADVSGTDRAYATGISAWGGCINLGVRNGHYLNGVNWIQADLPGLQPGNIRQGTNIGGLVGTMADYSYLASGQTSFNMGTYSGVLANGFWAQYTIQNYNDGSIDIRAYKTASENYMMLSKKSIHLGPFSKVRIEFSPKFYKSESYSWFEIICGFLPKTCYYNGYQILDSASNTGRPSFSPYFDHYSEWNKNGVYVYELNISPNYKNDFWFFGIQGSINTKNYKTNIISLRKIEFLT